MVDLPLSKMMEFVNGKDDIPYPPTPAAQGGARKGKGFSDTAGVANFSILYPPTPTTTTSSSTTAAAATSSSTSSRQQQGAAGSSRQQAAAGSSRQQQAAAGISRQQQTQADAAVSATAAVQQLAASQQRASSQPRETYSKLFVGDFRRDVPAPGHAYFGLCSSFRAMVFPRPGGPCHCGHSSSSSRCRPSVAWGFLAGSRLFEESGAAAAAAPSSQHRETYSKLCLGDFSRRFQKGRSGPGKRLFWTPFVLQGHGVSPSGRAVSLWAQQQQQ